ncbi:MAG TPA: hypothetical protein VHX63_10945 [Acidobacteriaceae bacterium]|jgi:TRAP-type C4-dicarboxylate transport system permease small subunit|nr:hypothetical protein [Acidobacteriaceae bacterium]
MTSAQDTSGVPPTGDQDAKLFGIPLGRFGLFSSLLLSVAAGFMAFFFTTFFAIFGVVIYDSFYHLSMQNLSISYKFISAPIGVMAMLFSLAYLLSIWVRRKLAHHD